MIDELQDSYIDGPLPVSTVVDEPAHEVDSDRLVLRLERVLHEAMSRIESDRRWDAAAEPLADCGRRLSVGILGDALLGRWIGHAAHPFLTDVPIGCWTSAGLVDVVFGRRGRPVARRLIGIGVLAAIPTVMSGLTEYARSDDVKVRRVGAAHASGNLVATSLYALSWNARRRGHHGRGVAWAAVGATLATASGHLGGHLAFVRAAGDGPRSLDAGAVSSEPSVADELDDSS